MKGKRRKDKDLDSNKHILVWGKTLKEMEQSALFGSAHKERPSTRLAPFGVSKSCGLDILTIVHNAVRTELNDMYSMYEAMTTLGTKLNHRDVEKSTLWFKDMFKFLVNNLLQWHWEVLLPWISSRIKVNQGDEEHLRTLCRRRGSIELMANETATSQESLYNELLTGANRDKVRSKLINVAVAVNDLGFRLTQYMSYAEVVITPIFGKANIAVKERNDMFRRLLFWIQDTGNVELDIPLLLRWMPHEEIEEWLNEHGFQRWEHAISVDTYVKWAHEQFYQSHHKIVEDLVNRAEKHAGSRYVKKFQKCGIDF